MKRTCLNCVSLNTWSSKNRCENNNKDILDLSYYCNDWEPNTLVELQMLREENEKLKNENLALPHLLEYNKELEEKTQWISMKSRLPEINSVILTWNGNNFSIDFFHKKRHQPYWDDITHWMPLPKKQKDER